MDRRPCYVMIRYSTLRGISQICLTLLIQGGFTQRCDHGIPENVTWHKSHIGQVRQFGVMRWKGPNIAFGSHRAYVDSLFLLILIVSSRNSIEKGFA